MFAIIKFKFILAAIFILSPEDPCTTKARESVLGQAGSQLIDALALSGAQKDNVFDIQTELFEGTEAATRNMELARQRLFDGFLQAVEDGRIDRDEVKYLHKLQKNQRMARQSVIDSYKQANQAIQILFHREQRAVLETFVPELLSWDEAVDDAKLLLKAFEKFRESYIAGEQTMLANFDHLMAALEHARPLVYIPPWIDFQLDAIANDLNIYREDFTNALRHIRPIKEAEQSEADLVLENAVALLAHAIDMTQSPAQAEATTSQPSFPFTADFNKTLLVTPLFHCLLADK